MAAKNKEKYTKSSQVELGTYKNSFLCLSTPTDDTCERLYIMTFGLYPNRLIINEKFKIANKSCYLNVDKFCTDLEKQFPDIQSVWRTYAVIHNSDKSSRTEYGTGPDNGRVNVIIKSIGVVFEFGATYNCTLCYGEDNEGIGTLLKMLKKKKYLKIIDNEVKKKIHLVTYDKGHYDLEKFDVKKYNVDIKKHYNNDFEAANNKIVSFLNEDNTSGLIILNGIKGSGKTTYIRHLIYNTDKRFVYISKEMMSCISDPSFISFLREIAGSILVLEDCENLVKARKTGNASTGISNLLNMCDGLLSDAFNIKIITTFNEDISKIDDALLRKGRLVQQYEFKQLCIEKTNKLFKSLGVDYVTDKPMALCDIFNFGNETGHQEKRTSIGFK